MSSVSSLYLSLVDIVQARPMCHLVARRGDVVAKGGEECTGMKRTSSRVMLICEECGETLVLGEPEEVWLSTRTRFECECGEDVSLASRAEKPIHQGATRDRRGFKHRA